MFTDKVQNEFKVGVFVALSIQGVHCGVNDFAVILHQMKTH
jgi:hypothetical protein